MVLFLSLAAALGASGPSAAKVTASKHAVTLLPAEPGITRSLRGDWEPPDLVVLCFTWSWPRAMAAILETIARRVPVVLLREEGTPRRDVTRWMSARPRSVRRRVTVLDRAVDSPWVRDYGPLSVRDEHDRTLWLDAAYVERPLDDMLPGELAAHFGAIVETIPWSLDGGALASNGTGLCASTRAYFGVHRIDVETASERQLLLRTLGCRLLVLVPELEDEPTHHIDLFVQFLARDVVAVGEIDPDLLPEDAARMDVVATALADAAARMGTPLSVVRVPLPVDVDGNVQSHLNGLRLGDVLVMPTFGRRFAPTAKVARHRIETAVPGLRVLPIPASELMALGGAIHCVALGLWLPPSASRPAI